MSIKYLTLKYRLRTHQQHVSCLLTFILLMQHLTLKVKLNVIALNIMAHSRHALVFFFLFSIFNTLTSRWTRATQKIPWLFKVHGWMDAEVWVEMEINQWAFTNRNEDSPSSARDFKPVLTFVLNTYDLKFSHISLPPQVLLILWAHSREHVIEVH